MIGGAGATPLRLSSRYLVALLSAVGIVQLALYINWFKSDIFFSAEAPFGKILYLVSLFLLLSVACAYYILHARLVQQARLGREQLDAMFAMFGDVKYKLNNDMQVILGNAELAGILVDNGGDASKPVRNISAAASHAVERIEQLSVFGATGSQNPTSVDLNAMFRHSMAKLTEELPSIVTLRLELEPLPTRVLVDRYLLSLSLTHLIKLAATSMRHGGEIVVRTSLLKGDAGGVPNTVVARVYIVRALCQSGYSAVGAYAPQEDQFGMPVAEDIEICRNGLKTVKALVERAGVKSVNLTRTDAESLLTMVFANDHELVSRKKPGA